MVKANIIHKRLTKLDEYLTFLQQAQQYQREEFLADPKLYGSIERYQLDAFQTLRRFFAQFI